MVREHLVCTTIPVYNRLALLRREVGSVREQTYRPIEIIIVDNGSSDDSGQVTDALAHDHPGEIAVMHQANAD